MNIPEIIKESITEASSLGLENRVRDLSIEETKLKDPHYRVAFVGQFKTGKSTLINRLILKENILFTDVTEATTIPVEIEYSESPHLELYRYEKKTVAVDDKKNSKNTLEYISGVALDKDIVNPTTQDIEQNTTRGTSEERAALASEFSHAKLYWPAPNLRRFTVVDTPGVNTPNEAVATATYRFLPECDLAIYVAFPKQLSQIDLQFLKGKVFESGITRVMIVLNFDPTYGQFDSNQLEKIKTEVEATLKDIGREYIPVIVAEVSRIDSTASDRLAQATAAQDNLNDWLEGTSPKTNIVTNDTVSSLETNLIQYIQNNIQPGREEKIRFRLRRILETTLAEIQIELGLLEQDAQTRQQTIVEIEKAQKQSQQDGQNIKEDFLADFHELQNDHLKILLRGFERIEENFSLKLDACKGVGDIKKRLKDSKPLLQMEVESLALEARKSVIEGLKDLETKYALKLREASKQWHDLDIALKIDGGILEKMPGFVVQGLDLLFIIFLSPFPFFIDIPLRLMVKGLPSIDKWLPASLAGDALKGWIKNSARSQFDHAKGEITDKLRDAYAEAERIVNEKWDKQLADQQQAIQSATDRAAATENGENRINLLKKASEKYKQLLGLLPA